MATIVLADDGIKFDGFTLAERPLGGAETAFISLAEGLAARGHDVTIVNNCDQVHENNGVKWQPLSNGFPATADLYIANRGHRLLDKMPEAKRTIFWIHNPAGYLLKWRYLSRLWKIKPAIVFSGAHHLATYPKWAPCGERIVIPYGIENRFMTADVNDAIRAKRAIFTSIHFGHLIGLLIFGPKKYIRFRRMRNCMFLPVLRHMGRRATRKPLG